MLRSIGAVLAGYIAIGILVVTTDRIAAAFDPGAHAGQTPPAYYFVVSLITAPLYSVLGGYICGRLARTNPWKHGVALAVFGELMGFASTAAFWGQQPLWYALGLLILYPPAVLLGARLSGRRSSVARAASV